MNKIIPEIEEVKELVVPCKKTSGFVMSVFDFVVALSWNTRNPHKGFPPFDLFKNVQWW